MVEGALRLLKVSPNLEFIHWCPYHPVLPVQAFDIILRIRKREQPGEGPVFRGGLARVVPDRVVLDEREKFINALNYDGPVDCSLVKIDV